MASDNPERGGARGDAALVHDRARVVRRYLSALDMRRPGRTAARTAESINHRLHQVDTLLLSADPVQRLHLTQERIDLHAEVLRLSTGAVTEFAEVEAAFVRVVRGYSERHGITFSAWRQIGVDTDVLERGGIATSKPARPPRPAVEKPVADKPVADEPAAAPVPDPSCLDEMPPMPRAEGPKADVTKKAKPPAAAKRNGAAKKPAGTAKGVSTPKAARSTKKVAAPVQQQLPADASS